MGCSVETVEETSMIQKKNDASRATHGHAHSGLAQKILRVSMIMVQAFSP